MDILTVAIVTKPFKFEGSRRMRQAEEGIRQLSQYVDSLVIIPNERLKQVSDTRITLFNAFEIADDVLRRGVQSISELINVPGFINLDFADVTSVMHDAGFAHMGVGSATGKDKAELAAKAAISSPLLETSIKGATGILVSISISPDVGLEDADLASTMIANEASPDANVIWGVAFDPDLDDEMKITIIATGFEKDAEEALENSAKQETVAAKPAEKKVEAPKAQPAAPAAEPQRNYEQRKEPAPQPKPAEPAKAQPAVETPAPENAAELPRDADGFDEIMSILRNRKHRDDFRGSGRR